MQRIIVRLERERDQARGMVDELKGKLDGAEDSLNQTLTKLESSKNEAKAAYQQGYNEGINVATESYKTQMPIFKMKSRLLLGQHALRRLVYLNHPPFGPKMTFQALLSSNLLRRRRRTTLIGS